MKAQRGCAEKLRVLGERTRLSVVELLLDGPRHVGDLNAVLGIEQSLLSHHLCILRRAAIVRAEREGKTVIYRLHPSITAGKNERSIHLGCCSIDFAGTNN